MLYVIIITIGITQYNYDNLSYKDLETCQYHKAKIEYRIRLTPYTRSVECIKKLK